MAWSRHSQRAELPWGRSAVIHVFAYWITPCWQVRSASIRQLLLETNANGETGRAFCAVGRPATRTKGRNQRFADLAAYGSIGLY